jgi:hypothetical protein
MCLAWALDHAANPMKRLFFGRLVEETTERELLALRLSAWTCTNWARQSGEGERGWGVLLVMCHG